MSTNLNRIRLFRRDSDVLQALRLLLHAISTSAARYGRCIVPVLSLSIDFYVRVFVRVYVSPALTKLAVT